ncbi:MAG TPA: O-antigen ligase family protein [Terriglobales bacterium]|nr:O-antigen ligase family protein [Terriglobales bacterium]
MIDRLSRFFPPVMIAICCLFGAYSAVFRPAYFSSSGELATLLFLQILLAAIWNYRARFFFLLLAVFLWAGMVLPLSVAWTSGRWLVLAVGALAGLVVYTRDQRYYFATFHLMALFCVVAALVSAAVSAYPSLAFLKAMSLLLLFLYGSSGARLAVIGREASFFPKLLLGCELLVYITAVSYFIFRSGIFGNPNSLGAVMGVAAAPILLWGILVSERPTTRWRRTFAFALTLLLLFSSYARAGIAAAVVSCILLCVALRRYGLLLRGLGVALALAAFVATVVPLHQQPSESLTSVFVYKGRREDGILASRRSIWDGTVLAIQEHPWLGSGFGTSPTSSEVVRQPGSFESLREATREHGNSYLAITEWVGFVGDIPFFGLVILIALNVSRALVQMRRTGNVLSPGIPLAGVLAAGLVHAAFEDWLFAPGYYLCVFFWTLAFIMVDVLPAPSAAPAAQSAPRAWTHSFGAATLGR